MPGEENPGHRFTVDRFVGQEEMREALERSSPRVREAYGLMESPPEFELYDLDADPYEFENLADKPQHQAELEELKGRLLEWRRQTDDAFLDAANVMRLREEIESTFIEGQYRRPQGWQYSRYLAPSVPAWLKEGDEPDLQ